MDTSELTQTRRSMVRRSMVRKLRSLSGTPSPTKKICRVSLERCDSLGTRTIRLESNEESVEPTASTSSAEPKPSTTVTAEGKKRKKHDAHVYDGHTWHVNKVAKNGTVYLDCSK